MMILTKLGTKIDNLLTANLISYPNESDQKDLQDSSLSCRKNWPKSSLISKEELLCNKIGYGTFLDLGHWKEFITLNQDSEISVKKCNLVEHSKKSAEKLTKFLGKIRQKPSMNEDGESEEQIRDFNISKHNSLINKSKLLPEVVDNDAKSDSMAAGPDQETQKSQQTSGKLDQNELSLDLDFIQCEPFEDQKIPSGQKNEVGHEQFSEVDEDSEVIYLSDEEAIIMEEGMCLLDDEPWTRAKPKKTKYPKNSRKRANSEGIPRKPKKIKDASIPDPKPIPQIFQSQILRKKPFIDYNRSSEYYKILVASDLHHWKSKQTPSNNSGITKIADKYSSKDTNTKNLERAQKRRLKSDQKRESRRQYEKIYRQRLKLTDGYKEKQRAKKVK
jgi:hypothetical protein